MEKIKQLLKLVISTLYGVEVEANVVAAPKDTGADFATNIAMSLTKTLKRNPLEIAEETGASTATISRVKTKKVKPLLPLVKLMCNKVTGRKQ